MCALSIVDFLSIRRLPSPPPSSHTQHQVLPADPTDQLELAHRIANMAFVGKVQQLERENAQLQQQAMDRQTKIKQLERRINGKGV